MSRRPIEEQAEETAARLGADGLRAEERARLWARIERSASRKGRRRAIRLGLAIAVPAAAAAAVWLAIWTPRDPCALDPSAGVFAIPQGCNGVQPVRVGADVWTLQPEAVVKRVDGGAQVSKGRVRFQVQKRDRERFRVRVSHGEVEVVGTVFEVVQREGGGSVTVSEGVVEFVWHDGTRERVVAGQRLVWPRAVERGVGTRAETRTEKETETETETEMERGAVAARSRDLEPVLERLMQLQSQRRFGESAVLLRETLESSGLTALQRERLSYELGLALEASSQPSCAHWKAHVKRFGVKRHADTLAERLERCDRE